MESPNNRDINQKLQELEASIGQESSGKIYPVEKVPDKSLDGANSDNVFSQIVSWYQGLPSNGKIVVLLTGGIGGLVVLGTVFRLISALFTLAVVGAGAYLVYKFWIEPKQEQ